MRKTILSIIALSALFATSCKKETAASKVVDTTNKASIMSGGTYVIPSDIHNTIGRSFYSRNGWNAPDFRFIIVDNVTTFDSVVGTSNNADSVASVMIAKANDWGLMDNNGFLKPISLTMPIMLSMEPNLDLRSAFTDIASYRGPNPDTYTTTRLNAVHLTNENDISRRSIYLSIYLQSLQMNYPINEVMGWTAEGYAAADAEGAAIWANYTAPAPKGQSEIGWSWAYWGACSWSNNYSCHNM